MLLFFSICALVCAAILSLGLMVYARAPHISEQAIAKAHLQNLTLDTQDQMAKGLMDEAESRFILAEAGRHLLKLSETHDPQIKSAPKTASLIIGAIGLISLGLYSLNNSDPALDQPFSDRLAALTALSKTSPESLSPPQMAMVLRQFQTSRANDPRYWSYLGQADRQAEHYSDAVHDYEHLTQLEPNTSMAWGELGMALMSMWQKSGSGTLPDPEAKRALDTAIRLDPTAIPPQFFRAELAMAEGDFDQALSHFMILKSRLPATDSRQSDIDQSIVAIKSEIQKRQAQNDMIKAMVSGLKAKLIAEPNNPQGWARLLRSEKILGDEAGAQNSLATIKVIYAKNPDQVQQIIDMANAPVGAQEIK